MQSALTLQLTVHDVNTDKYNYLDLVIAISLSYVTTLCGLLNN